MNIVKLLMLVGVMFFVFTPYMYGKKSGGSNTGYKADSSLPEKDFYNDSITINESLTSQVSKRALDKNINKEKTIYNYKPVNDYTKNEPNTNSESITSSLFEESQVNYYHHILRAPNIGKNIKSKQTINNGVTENIKAKSKDSSSFASSYLYSLTPRFRLGPELLHTSYDSKANIVVNDSFSFLVRGEWSLYKNENIDFYFLGGAGVSLNALSFLYTRLTISTSNSPNYFKEYVVKPIINGSSVPHKTAYFYCSTYPRFNNIDIDVIPDPNDSFKGTSFFKGDGFGICVYENSDKTKNYTIAYEEFLTPENAISIPWFIGFGLDYSLSPLLSKITFKTNIDRDTKSTYDLGVSMNVRYFNNGNTTVKYNRGNVVDQYTIKYDGYISINVGLYLKL